MTKLCCILLACLLLPACAARYSSNGENLYLKSQNGPKLQVPPPLTGANLSTFYDLPPQNQRAEVSIAPPSV